ncbi:MAG: S1-like domain-containing RNA-binding protein [Armatimonadota bacterium]
MKVGEWQDLKVKRESEYGLYLSDGGETEVLLPENQCPDDALVGHSLKVFIYTDSEDRIIATRMKPHAAVGEFAVMKVLMVTGQGAFLDWGLMKDLFCPFKQQHFELREGDEVLVYVYLDEKSNRVACTTRWSKHLTPHQDELAQGDAIKMLVADITPEFASVIVNGKFKGAIFRDEWVDELKVGQKRKGFVKRVRDDGQLALSLRPQGYGAVLGERDRVVRALEANGGSLPLSDKSSPDEILRAFGMSKGAFKRLIGTMYREGIIVIEDDRIALVIC